MRGLLLVIISILFIGCSNEQPYKVVNKGKIKTYYNSNKNDSILYKLELNEVFSFKPENFMDTDFEFYNIGSASIGQFDSQNNIYLLNRTDFKIYKFSIDTTIKLEASFGGKGGGPGEYRFPTELVVMKDNIYTNDAYGNKLINFTSNGEFKQVIRLKAAISSPLVITGNKLLCHLLKRVSEGKNIFTKINLIEFSATLDTNFIFTNYKIPVNEKKPIDPKRKPIVNFAANSNKIFIAEKSNDRYLIKVYNSKTRAVESIIRKKYLRVPYSDKEIQKMNESMKRKYGNLGVRYEVKQKFKDAISFIECDQDGKLLVKAVNTGKRVFDIFSENIFIGRLDLANLGLKFDNYQFKGKYFITYNYLEKEIKFYTYNYKKA